VREWATHTSPRKPSPDPRKRTLPEQAVRAEIFLFGLVRSRVAGPPKPTRIDENGKKK
jgi:hypothetical protein